MVTQAEQAEQRRWRCSGWAAPASLRPLAASDPPYRKDVTSTFLEQMRAYIFWAAVILFLMIMAAVICNSEEFSQFNFSLFDEESSGDSIPRILVATMLTDDAYLYGKGAKMLIRSIKSRSLLPKGVDFKILELDSKPVDDDLRAMLNQAGWTFVRKPRIPPRNEARTFGRFRDQFSKLHFWNMTEYDRILYFDSDCLVVGSIDDLLKMNISGKPLWATRDTRGPGAPNGGWVDGFNMGVFMIEPSSEEYTRLLHAKEDTNIGFDNGSAEQGFLNVIYKDLWGEIGFGNNANLAVYVADRSYWDQRNSSINVVHYTMQKPWSCGRPFEPICSFWKYS